MRGHSFCTLIVDDDQVAIDELKRGLSKHSSSIDIIGECYNAQTAKETIIEVRPEILFLDIELPDTKGIELLNSIKGLVDWDMIVIFYSAHSRYILNAMRESAFDFLLKPFCQEELDGILDRIYQAKKDNDFRNILEIPEKDFIQGSFIAATVTGYRIIKLDEIGYFTHQGICKQWYANLVSGESLCLKRGTSAENILGYSQLFFQISQSAIVNINYLAAIDGKDCTLIPPFDKVSNLKISRNFLKKLQEKLNLI